MPFGPLRLQIVETARDAFLARAADGEFHDQNGQRENNQEKKVQQHECRATVLAGNVGETPNVAQPNSASRTDEDEPQP